MEHNESGDKINVHGNESSKLKQKSYQQLNNTPELFKSKEANTPKSSRRQDVCKLRDKINKVETDTTIQGINETRS